MDHLLRTILKQGVRGNKSHLDITTVFDGLDYRFVGLYPTAIPNNIWQIAEHMLLWVDLKVKLFKGEAIFLPDGHGFSTSSRPGSEAAWEQFKLDYRSAILQIESMIDTLDLAKRYPAWNDLTAAEIIEMMCNHNSYHAAQVVAMRRLLGVWPR